MLGIILIGSYFLLNQPKQTFNPALEISNPTSSLGPSTLSNESSTKSSDATNNTVPDQEIQTLTTPEFTLVYKDNSYFVPPTYDVDPYTGKKITISFGYEVL